MLRGTSRARLLGMFAALLLPGAACAWCWDAAAARYVPSIDPKVLIAISKHESGWRPNAHHFNADGSVDRCLMQINSTHLKTLRPFGVDERSIYRPCSCIEAGAWVLADCIATFGATWAAVGCYHTGPSPRRAAARRAYAQQIKAIYDRLTDEDLAAPRDHLRTATLAPRS